MPKIRDFCLKLLKCVLFFVRRIKKLATMRQLKIAIALLALGSCFVTLLLYYWHRSTVTRSLYPKLPVETTTNKENFGIVGTRMRHMRLDVLYRDVPKRAGDSFETEDHRVALMLETPGCEIPVAMVDYEKYLTKLRYSPVCERRAVSLRKIDNDKIHVTIKNHLMRKYLRRSAHFECCYRFIRKLIYQTHGGQKVMHSICKKVQDDSIIPLNMDFVNVKCYEYDKRNTTHAIYDDMYAFVKRVKTPKPNPTHKKNKFNVLLLGMDSMSLPRFVKTMSQTTSFFNGNFWLGYRGYHKVADNTFPNLMAALTGLNISTITEKCSGKMDQCNDLLLWSAFKKAGYVTAYGEDYLRLPDTFNNNFEFRSAPTDHYMRPLFLKGETELFNKSLVCAGKLPSAQHILDYALDFTLTYRNDSFFGLFWINSYSHNENSRPQDSDGMFENFFYQLTYTNTLDNTFVIFFSDHGLRFGEHRLKIESYYDERMPSLFIWTPWSFKRTYPVQFHALAVNQFRLVTPYDLYNTLVDINHLSVHNNFTETASEACPECQSLFSVVSDNRTCEDVAIHEKWCSCHKLYPLDIQDIEGMKSVMFVVQYIKSKIKTIKTKRCWDCMNLSLNNVVRIHFYYDKEKINLYHVVAFAVTPGNMFYEATVLRTGNKSEVVGPVSAISPYRGLGKCVIEQKHRLFCVCQMKSHCN